MATYYFNPIAGSDSNNGLTPALAKASFDVFRANNLGTFGDTFLLHRGMEHVVANRNLPSGNSLGNPTTVESYGEAQVPYAIVKAGSSVAALNISQRNYTLLKNILFDGNGLTVPVYISSTATNSSTGHRVQRCKFTNSAGDNPGLYIGRENTTNTSTDYIVEDCEFYDNAASGITLMAVQNAIIRRCKAWRNGASGIGGGHGIHTQSRHIFHTSGWVLVTGTIYNRALPAFATDVFFVRHPSYPHMVKNTATPTAPGVGEFGVDSGNLYVNVGANPNGPTMAYVWSVSSGIQYEFCEAFQNLFGVAPFQEGHGLSFDDWTSDSVMKGCVSHNNEGRGFSINGGTGNRLFGCIAYGNESVGFASGSGPSNTVRNCTFFNNNVGRGANAAEMLFDNTANNSTVSNSILIGTSAIGINFGTATGCVASTNGISGFATAVSGGTVSGTITTDARPYVRSDGSLIVPDTATIATVGTENPFATSGAYAAGVTLANGRLRPGYAPVGAYMAVVPRSPRL